MTIELVSTVTSTDGPVIQTSVSLFAVEAKQHLHNANNKVS